MKTIHSLCIATALAVASAGLAAQPAFKEPLNTLSPKQKQARELAMKGDYQAMRNIAYSYASPAAGEAGSKVAACAWYLLVPVVHKTKFNSGDTGNVSVYCGKLSPSELNEAYDYAFRTIAQ